MLMAKSIVVYIFTLPTILFLYFFFRRLTSNKRKRLSVALSTLFLFFVFSLPIISEILSYPLHSFVKTFKEEYKNNIKLILVPTAGIEKDPMGQWRPTRTSSNRLLEAYKVAKNTSMPILLSGGFTKKEAPSEAFVINNFHKIPNVQLDQNSKNTYETAINNKDICSKGKNLILLVTSKIHTLRSYLTFKSHGCNILVLNNSFDLKLSSLLPALYGYANLNSVVYEYIGLMYYIFTNKINLINLISS